MQIIMPKLGLTMTEATIREWLKAPGDAVMSGEVLFNYDTEKVTLDYEAPSDGVLIKILTPPGSRCRPGPSFASIVRRPRHKLLRQRQAGAPRVPRRHQERGGWPLNGISTWRRCLDAVRAVASRPPMSSRHIRQKKASRWKHCLRP